jgi:energy-converting hydrogenase Eha subunit G
MFIKALASCLVLPGLLFAAAEMVNISYVR